MQSDHATACLPEAPARDPTAAKVISPREALARELKPLAVAAGADVVFSPYEREYEDYFARVSVSTFDDLKTLGFVPSGIAEEKVRRAIATDDEETYKLAHTRVANAPAQSHECECQTAARNGSGSPLRQQYEGLRKAHNPALARVLSDHLQTKVDWDSPIASIVRGWVRYTEVAKASVIGIAIVNDITIDRGAILRVDQSSKALYAGTIWIHATGRLVYDGGYLKIWARAIANLSKLAVSVTALKDIPWRIAA
jgi:hypothetical protein